MTTPFLHDEKLDHFDRRATLVLADLAQRKEGAVCITETNATADGMACFDLALVDLAAVAAKRTVEVGEHDGREVGEESLDVKQARAASIGGHFIQLVERMALINGKSGGSGTA